MLIIFLFILQQFEFSKAAIPDKKEDRIELAKKLAKYNISLSQYENSLGQREIKS